MTSQEKLILKFLVTILVIGSAVGIVRRTWFPQSLSGRDDGERIAREMASVIKQTSDPGVRLPGKVDLNTASKRELVALPGIGEALAERIILYREDYGQFESVQDLTRIRGIGKKTMETLEALVTVGGSGKGGEIHD